jgi:hypothetical protein
MSKSDGLDRSLEDALDSKIVGIAGSRLALDGYSFENLMMDENRVGILQGYRYWATSYVEGEGGSHCVGRSHFEISFGIVGCTMEFVCRSYT